MSESGPHKKTTSETKLNVIKQPLIDFNLKIFITYTRFSFALFYDLSLTNFLRENKLL